MLKKMCLNSHTHLHKEEAGHDVGAGFLKPSVCRKVPHCPLLCWQATVHHLLGKRKSFCKASVYWIYSVELILILSLCVYSLHPLSERSCFSSSPHCFPLTGCPLQTNRFEQQVDEGPVLYSQDCGSDHCGNIASHCHHIEPRVEKMIWNWVFRAVWSLNVWLTLTICIHTDLTLSHVYWGDFGQNQSQY